jgi:hypothetical protein
LHRPRRRPLLRLAVTLVVLIVFATTGSWLAWVRVNVVPPDCLSPNTLSMVRESLTGRFNLPQSVRLEEVRTIVGGYFALRYVCEAHLAGIDPNLLPPGAPIPGSVDFISRLSSDHRRHEVIVSVEPQLKWERVD